MSATDFGEPGQVLPVPGRDLCGTRDEKLAELDLLLTQLQGVRMALSGHLGSTEARVDTAPETAPSPVRRTGRRHKRLRVLLVLVVVVSGAASAWAQAPEDDAAEPPQIENAEQATDDDVWRSLEFRVPLVGLVWWFGNTQGAW
ncbi:MAG: hypothetical protein AB7G23_11345 [Vicinamibacterales bacterium]